MVIVPHAVASPAIEEAHREEAAASLQRVRLIARISEDASQKLKELAKLCEEKTPEEVRKAFEELPEADKASADGLVLFASILCAENRLDEAERTLTRLREHPDVPLPQLLQAASYLAHRKLHLEVAVALVRRAGKMDSNSPMVDYVLCRCLMAQEKFDEDYEAAKTAKSKFAKYERDGKSPCHGY
jgi:predicted Zn-dependent protease